jgi:hypothetical protein
LDWWAGKVWRMFAWSAFMVMIKMAIMLLLFFFFPLLFFWFWLFSGSVNNLSDLLELKNGRLNILV